MSFAKDNCVSHYNSSEKYWSLLIGINDCSIRVIYQYFLNYYNPMVGQIPPPFCGGELSFFLEKKTPVILKFSDHFDKCYM